MKYITKNENAKAFMLSLTLCIISVICVLFAGQIPNYKWIFQLLFVCFATTGIQILLKYALTCFEYVMSENILLIYKSIGRRKMLICRINLFEAKGHTIKTNIKDMKNGDTQIINLVRNINAKEVYKLDVLSNGASYTVNMEISAEFAKAIDDKIDFYSKGITENGAIK